MGGLIAFDRGDRQVAALLEAARRRRDQVVTSSGCVAQAWRGGGSRQALLARLLAGTTEVGLDRWTSRATGDLCQASKTADVVDAHVALLARNGDVLVTSDANDFRRLLRARRINAQILSR
jgi:hypothetical protein